MTRRYVVHASIAVQDGKTQCAEVEGMDRLAALEDQADGAKLK